MIPLKNILLLAFFSLGLACSSPAQPATAIKVKSGQKIAFLGDSITQQGWDNPGGYVHLVADALDSAGVKIIPVPAGISGNTSREMLARLDISVLSKKPDWMTLSCGVNDVGRSVDLDTYKTNITAIVDKAQAAGINILILTATVIKEADNANNQKLTAYNEFLKQLAKEKHLLLSDLNGSFWNAIKAAPANRGTNLLTVDGIHMNPMGNLLMARGILEAFGVSQTQVDAFEKNWRQSPNATAITAQLAISATAPISIFTYDALGAIATEQKIPPNVMQSNLLFEALRTVLKAHEQDAALTLAQAQGEVQVVFRQKLEAIVAAQKH